MGGACSKKSDTSIKAEEGPHKFEDEAKKPVKEKPPQNAPDIVVNSASEVVAEDKGKAWSIRGRVIDGEGNPVHNLKLKLYDADCIADDKLGVGTTAADGTFRISYDPDDAGLLDTPDLKLTPYTPLVKYKKPTDKPITRFISSEVSSAEHSNVSSRSLDVGDVTFNLWEYREAGADPTPRAGVFTQETKRGNTFELVKSLVEVVGDVIGVDLPQTATQKLGDDALTDAYHGDMALNGFNPGLLKIDEIDGKKRYHVTHSWSGYPLDATHFAVDTTAYFVEENGGIVLDEIEVSKRVGGFVSGPDAVVSKPVSFSKSESTSEMWSRAKIAWRCNYLAFGEIYTHLMETHYNVEQYLIPFYKNLRLNPIYRLLSPHGVGTIQINKAADDLLTSETGILQTHTAAGPHAVNMMISEKFGGLNWYGWTPRTPLCENDKFSRLQEKYWGVLEEYVAGFLKENEGAIGEYWHEIKGFSDEVVKHSVGFKSWGGGWVCQNEISKEDAPRGVNSQGEQSAVSPITTDTTLTDANKQQNLDNLKQLCKYLIHHTTLRHCFINDKQYDLAGDVSFCSLGLLSDVTDPEVPISSALPKDGKQKQLVWVLTNTEYGYLTKDEDRNIHPRLKELLQARAEEFAALGMPIDNIRSCINI